MHLQLMHESLARFSENFAAFLYGLNMNAFCVDFPEVRAQDIPARLSDLADIIHRRPFPTHFVEHSNMMSN